VVEQKAEEVTLTRRAKAIENMGILADGKVCENLHR
jgi:hypothetical protein